MTIATNIFAAIGLLSVLGSIGTVAGFMWAGRNRTDHTAARQAAKARHPAGGRQPHLHLASDDAA